jgi:aldehyde dehydrogenase (NAD+)
MSFLKHPRALYINGEWVEAQQFETVINPATEDVIAEAPVGSAEHVLAAIGAAREAFDNGSWPHLPIRERQRYVTEFLDGIERRKPAVIAQIIAEAGATQGLADYLQYGIPMQHGRHMVELASRPAVTGRTDARRRRDLARAHGRGRGNHAV